MIFQPTTDTTTSSTADSPPVSALSFGVFVDVDTLTPAVSPESDDQFTTATDPHHRTLTPMRFMALDILHDVNPAQKSATINSRLPNTSKELENTKPRLTIPRYHLYRYDLESFYYVLIWACTHYNLQGRNRVKRSSSSRLSGWASRCVDNVRQIKRLSRSGDNQYLDYYAFYEWNSVWSHWVDPLVSMFAAVLDKHAPCHSQNQTGNDLDSCGGRITFENFMKAIGEDFSENSASDSV